MALNLVLFTGFFPYKFLCLRCFGTTIGGKIHGIKIVKEDGSKLDFITTFKRLAHYFILTLITFISLIIEVTDDINYVDDGPTMYISLFVTFLLVVFMVWNITKLSGQYKQSPFDRFAKTVVIKICHKA